MLIAVPTMKKFTLNVCILETLFLVCVLSPVASLSDNDIDSLGDSDKTTTQAQFRVTRIEKRETAEAYHVRAVYEGEANPALYVGSDYQEFADQGTPGSAEFTVPRGLHEDSHYVLLAFPDRFLVLHLDLNTTASSMDVPPFQIKVRQGSEIKFYRGQDVKFDVSFDVEGDAYGYADIHYQIFSQAESEDNVLVRHGRHDHYGSDADLITLDTEKEGGTKGHGYKNYVLNSTKSDVEGIAEFDLVVMFNCSENCLVQYLRSFILVQFYQEDHDGPFPEGFLGFIHSQGEDTSVSYCAVNSSYCDIICAAYGHNLASIGITKANAAHEDREGTAFNIVYGDFGFTMLSISTVGFEEAGLYQCVATAAGKEIREQREVHVIQPPEIDRALSGVTRLDNGSLLFTCLANGVPAPDLTLSQYYSESLPEPHVTHPSQSETRVEVMVSDPDLVRSSEVLCQAINVDGNINDPYDFMDSYYIEIPRI